MLAFILGLLCLGQTIQPAHASSVDGHLIILQYHHIHQNTPFSTSTSPKKFLAHLELIKQMNLPVVDLTEALSTLFKQGKLKRTSVAITFDDGFISVYNHAFKHLQARKWPFTVFVNPQLVSSSSLYMNWQQLKTLKKHGAVIANHGQTHAYLLNKPKGISWDSWLNQEILQAQKHIEQQLGATPKLLAYAYGEFNLQIAKWLDKHEYLALGQHSGPASIYSHKQAIARFPVGGNHASVAKLKEKLNSLPLPIDYTQWQNPVLKTNPPLLKIHFKSRDINVKTVQCYSNNEGKIPTFATNSDGHIEVQAHSKNPINSGRDRYNCAMQSKHHPRRFYWYSQLWINLQVFPR